MGDRTALKSGQEQTAVLICSVWCFFCLVGQTFLAAPLWRFRKHYWMVCRWTEGEIISIVAALSIYTMSRPYSLWAFLVQQGRHESELESHQLTVELVAGLLSMGPCSCMMCLTCRRAWFQYYSAMVAVKVGLAEWRQLIDESLITEDVSWFLRHKHTWGNRKFLDNVSIAVWIIVNLVALALPLLHLSDTWVYWAIAVIPAIFFIALSHAYPTFQDEVELRKEKRSTSVVIVLVFGVWLLSSFLPNLVGWEWDTHKTEMRINGCIRQMWLGLGGSFTLFALSNLIICNFVRSTFSIKVIHLEMPLVFDMFSQSRLLSPRLSSNSFRDISVSLKSILSDNLEMSAFMSHLFAEFSFENMCCAVECCKFRDQMMHLNGSRMDDNNPTDLQFCEDVRNTRSTIVDQMQSLSDVRLVASMIADKYLVDDSPYQVNLSSRLRSAIMNELEDIQDVELDHTLFDSIIAECMILLRDSLTRFKRD